MSETRTLATWGLAHPLAIRDAATRARAQVGLDQLLLEAVAEGSLAGAFHAYVNPPCVVLGLSRKVAVDTDPRAMETRGVPLVRRTTGGGTVYHDAGTLNLAWALPWDWLPPGSGLRSAATDPVTGFVLDLVRDALLQGFALATVRTRISDLAGGSPPRKFAGSGQKRIKAGVLHHMSLLLETDLAVMSALLPVPPERAGISHAAFLTTLAQLCGQPAGALAAPLESLVLETTCSALGAAPAPIGEARRAELGGTAETRVASEWGREAWLRRV